MRISDWSSDVCSSDLKNIIVSSSERFDTYEYNGVTYEDVNVTQPVNSQKGYVYGLELSYTNPNFGLPGILNGLGMYGNFTYLKGGYKQIGRAHVCTTVHYTHLVCLLLFEKTN